MTTEELTSPTKKSLLSTLPFSKQSAITLFLVASFPINFWAIIVWFRNFGSVAEENGTWDAIGVGAYLLLFALLESVVIFLVLLLISMLVAIKLGQQKTLAQVSVLYLALTLALMLEQTRALIELPREGFLLRSLNSIINALSSSPVVILVIAAVLGVASIAAIHRNERVRAGVMTAIEKVVLLSGIYLFLDVVAIIIVVIRNL